MGEKKNKIEGDLMSDQIFLFSIEKRSKKKVRGVVTHDTWKTIYPFHSKDKKFMKQTKDMGFFTAHVLTTAESYGNGVLAQYNVRMTDIKAKK